MCVYPYPIWICVQTVSMCLLSICVGSPDSYHQPTSGSKCHQRHQGFNDLWSNTWPQCDSSVGDDFSFVLTWKKSEKSNESQVEKVSIFIILAEDSKKKKAECPCTLNFQTSFKEKEIFSIEAMPKSCLYSQWLHEEHINSWVGGLLGFLLLGRNSLLTSAHLAIAPFFIQISPFEKRHSLAISAIWKQSGLHLSTMLF